MTLFLVGLGVVLAGGLLALRGSAVVAATATVVGCGLGLIPAVRVLAGAPAESLRAAWSVPYGSFAVEIDALSALFLVPVLGLSALAAVYGAGYLGRGNGPAWFFTALLVASMALVVVARNGVLFLVAWETMALASFFLVAHESAKREVRDAAWTYLVATHIGAAFLLAFFVLIGRGAGSLDFDRLGAYPRALGPTLFVLALVAFGSKAGFMPMHVWLPDAHPAAPSHVSALMSGVMIKTGIYGLLRAILLLGPPPAWWGWTLVAIGCVSGVLGVLFALAQHDLKRLLAYSSVENIGIIALGIGLGLVGVSAGAPALAALGFAGALLHLVNHAAFKGLLFLGAGSVLHATGTRDMDHLGGLLKRMPLTGASFLVGAAAISGLPPLNGFVSEFLIFLGAFGGGASLPAAQAVPAIATIGALALIGGLAAACFTKAFGIVFLGEPRGAHAEHAHDPGIAMRLPMFALAAACVAIGVLAPFAIDPLAPAVGQMAGRLAQERLAEAATPLAYVAAGGAGILALVTLLALVRLALLRGREVGEGGTWGCGYAQPTARMQYTSSSFAQPLTELFAPVLRTRRRLDAPAGLFPKGASLATETPDVCREALFRPAFLLVGWALARLGWLQQGRVHLYVLYIALTLLVLLVWKLA
jgi:formate hydrogenlyase subunit 3/multisubunit Na+/H+ antiporter MnhD subunit